MFVIAGLGNPGPKYSGTRHNVGFDTIDILADKYGIAIDFEKHKAMCGKGVIEGNKVLLVKPLTFMNLSGEALQQIAAYYKIDPEEELIVISDDIDLDPGRIRIRPKGSAGGHNGLKNIIALLGTDKFARVKIGVGSKPKGWDLADWVLGHFDSEDAAAVKESKQRAAEAVVTMMNEGVDSAMNMYNSR
ncbi:MAG: aminoacyl-tRNA hydrolase [Lachnospiraceae bacterium]|nr:aminoacyl-tRNA hydrolase [Lachnospiraceae bacterium]